MEILKGVNLGFAYDYTLFEDVNLSVNAGGSCAITGVSGCGKSNYEIGRASCRERV